MSKPFTYGQALRVHGADHVLERVGVEPTGESFNAIVLDEANNRPYNPMVNAGAIAVAAMMPGADKAAREAGLLDLFSRLAGRTLSLDEAVYRSESETGHRNRAIAYMMLSAGMIEGDPEAVLDLYFRQCSVLVTARDMAVMAATLAHRGTNPLTDVSVYEPEQVREVLTVMNTCGMYNYAGQWAHEVGLPAKSGVCGGIIAVIPGEAGIAVYSPRLDALGNSVRGIAACRELSRHFNLHAFSDRTTTRDVVRRTYTAAEIGSKRIRSSAQRALLAELGKRIAVIELQGGLFFGATELAVRRLGETAAEADHVIIDFRRVGFADRAAIELITGALGSLGDGPCRLVCTGLNDHRALVALQAAMPSAPSLRFAADIDTALEAAEEAVLSGYYETRDTTKYAFGAIDLLRGLDEDAYRLLEHIVSVFHFEPGQQILTQGDEANALFVIVRGSVSVTVDLPGGQRRRIGSIGPGHSFGEMALVDGGRRTANVHADERVIAYGFSIDGLNTVSKERPEVLVTILRNIVSSLAGRLKLANEEIRNLE
jgi:glutaminase